jgi:hypothetical protein
MTGEAPYKADFSAKRRLIEKAYIDIAGIEGEANYKPSTSNLDILLTSLREAPKVFGEAVGTVAKELGGAAGSLAGGIVKGLGFGGMFGLLLVVAVIVLVVTKGTIIGRVARLIGGGA